MKLKSLLPILLPIILTLGLSYYLQIKVANNQHGFTLWLSTFGPFVLVIYFILQAITIIVAPIGGFFLFVSILILYGPEKAIILSYIATTPWYLLNFYLARRYGRPLVIKMLGHHSLEKLDHLVKDAGLYILITTRVLQSPNFDYLSYAWGLTKIPFRVFLIVNFVAGIPGALLSYLIFKEANNIWIGLGIFYLSTAILGGLTIYLTHFLRKHRKF